MLYKHISSVRFEWNQAKNLINQIKHGIRFEDAQHVFADPRSLIFIDTLHSSVAEVRYKCIGKLGTRICTVRYTRKDGIIRIFGAGFWRKERKYYEKYYK